MNKKETQNNLLQSRLSAKDYKLNFECDMHPPLDLKTAKIEAQRCYFCYDAPCIEACPTEINIPSFIRKIYTENLKGSAIDIFKENILGGSCARVCPTESLCEGACVRQSAEKKPVLIGQLQKFATDYYIAQKYAHPFKRQKTSGKKVAIIGAGPAGLSCAHGLAKKGHDVVIFEAKEKAGGLNEYGIAAYKMVNGFAQTEVEFIKGIGGIEIKYSQKLGGDFLLNELQENYNAVFLAFGLGAVNSLGLVNENIPGVIDAVDYIAKLRQSQDLTKLPIARDIVVIGGGSTAIDIAVQTKRLGAENVTLVYRRGQESMSATEKEINFAQKNGVLIKLWARPTEIKGDSNGVTSVDFEYTKLENMKLTGTSDVFNIKADMVFKAIGQKLVDANDLGIGELNISQTKITVDQKTFMTPLNGVFAGGDCVFGNDLTVVAVRQGKLAAKAIHNFLGGQSG